MIIKYVCFCEIDWSNFCIEKKEKLKHEKTHSLTHPLSISLPLIHANVCNEGRREEKKLSLVGKPLYTCTRLLFYFADDRFTCLIWIVLCALFFFISVPITHIHTLFPIIFSLVHYFYFLSLLFLLCHRSDDSLFFFLVPQFLWIYCCSIGTSLLLFFRTHIFFFHYSFDRCAFISFSCSFTIRAKVSRVRNEISPLRKYHEPNSQPANITYISSIQLTFKHIRQIEILKCKLVCCLCLFVFFSFRFISFLFGIVNEPRLTEKNTTNSKTTAYRWRKRNNK